MHNGLETLQHQQHIESLTGLHLCLRFKKELQLLDSRDDPHTHRRQGCQECQNRVSSSALTVSNSVNSTSWFFSLPCSPAPISSLLSSCDEVITPVFVTLSYVLLKKKRCAGVLCHITSWTGGVGLAPEGLDGFRRVTVLKARAFKVNKVEMLERKPFCWNGLKILT